MDTLKILKLMKGWRLKCSLILTLAILQDNGAVGKWPNVWMKLP